MGSQGLRLLLELILEERSAPSHKLNVRRNYFTRVWTPLSDLNPGVLPELRFGTLAFSQDDTGRGLNSPDCLGGLPRVSGTPGLHCTRKRNLIDQTGSIRPETRNCRHASKPRVSRKDPQGQGEWSRPTSTHRGIAHGRGDREISTVHTGSSRAGVGGLEAETF